MPTPHPVQQMLKFIEFTLKYRLNTRTHLCAGAKRGLALKLCFFLFEQVRLQSDIIQLPSWIRHECAL